MKWSNLSDKLCCISTTSDREAGLYIRDNFKKKITLDIFAETNDLVETTILEFGLKKIRTFGLFSSNSNYIRLACSLLQLNLTEIEG